MTELILAIPGPWPKQASLLEAVLTLDPPGTYFLGAGMLAHPAGRDHVPMIFAEEESGGVSCLFFPPNLPQERERVMKFTRVIQRAGGLHVEVESSGARHEWDRWFALLEGNRFDHYCAIVTLTGDERRYHSLGMGAFGLADCSVPRDLDRVAAADLMNRFNYWRISANPELATGETFSVTADSPSYRLNLVPDSRHDPEDARHNSEGVWELSLANR